MKGNEEDKAWVTISRAVNLGNYNNVRVEVGYSQTIKSTDDPMDLIEGMEEQLEENLSRKVEEIEGENDDEISTERRRRKRR